MSIKLKLKQYEMTLKEFAKYLEISRPTLDSYISIYEKGGKLSREKYQFLFNALFSQGKLNKEEVHAIVTTFNRLIKKDIQNGLVDFGFQSTDLMTSIVERMKSDFESENFDEDIYVFINTLINTYKEEPILKKVITCISTMNGALSIDDMTLEEKKFSSNLYKLFIDDKNNALEYDEQSFNKFQNYVTRINKRKKRETEKIETEVKQKIEEEIKQKIEEEIKRKIHMGINPKDIDIDLLIKNINFDLED